MSKPYATLQWRSVDHGSAHALSALQPRIGAPVTCAIHPADARPGDDPADRRALALNVTHMPTRRRRTRIAAQTMELGLAIPEVVAYRVARMALAGSSPSRADREEFFRMGAEKVSAFYESWNAIFLAACRANLQCLSFWPSWSSVWLGPGRRTLGTKLQRATLDIMASGIAPVHRRAIGNAKRLRK